MRHYVLVEFEEALLRGCSPLIQGVRLTDAVDVVVECMRQTLARFVIWDENPGQVQKPEVRFSPEPLFKTMCWTTIIVYPVGYVSGIPIHPIGRLFNPTWIRLWR